MFTEKPLASSIEAGQKKIDAEKTSGAWVVVGYHERSDPAAMYAKAEIDRLGRTGELGAMRHELYGRDQRRDETAVWRLGGVGDLIVSRETSGW